MASASIAQLLEPRWSQIAVLTAFLLLSAVLVLARRRSRVISRIDGPPASTWWLGSLVDYLSSEGQLSLEWVKQYGSVVRYKGFLQADHLLIADTKAIAHIFSAGPYNWERDTVNKPRFAAMFGNGLISTVGQTHRRLRRVMLPAFNTPNILGLLPKFVASATELTDKWRKDMQGDDFAGEVELTQDILFATLNAVGDAGFGYHFDCFNKGFADPLLASLVVVDQIGNARNYRQILLESFVDMLPAKALKLVFALPFASGRGLREPLATMHDTSRQLYEQGLAAAEDDGRERRRDDLLSILVKANLSEKPSQRMSAKEVQDQMLTFIFAGWTAVLGTLTEALALLASPEYQHVQKRLREELLQLGPSPTADELLGGAAPYLDAVFRELLRYSEPTQLERVAARDDVIPLSKPVKLRDGSSIDCIPVVKGQLVSIPVMAVNRDQARFGADADTFRPERWLTAEGAKQRAYNGLGPGAWEGLMNFGSGTRSCPGSRFANLEIKVFLHVILTTYDLTTGSNKYAVKLIPLTTLPD